MPYRKNQFANNEIYHIILRGIDDNLIFKDVDDYYRMIFSIYELNNATPTTIQRQREARRRFKKENRGPSSTADERDKFVEILAFCFMPNHIHLLLKQTKDRGITKFMSKVGTGYAGYFNRKYQRKGYVFQNRFKDIYIKDDDQLKIVFNYIHANPISLVEPGWKEQGIKNSKEVIKFLEEYKWSSYQDYIGQKNFPSVTQRDFLIELFGGEQKCGETVGDWIEYKQKLNRFPEIFLD
jgi:putative transposase